MLRSAIATAPTAIQPDETRQSGQFLALAESWLQRRRTRRDLAQLDERLLRDIGLSPSEAIAESAMPFWRPFVGLQGK